MNRRNQNNIGETNTTSVKVHHNPGGKSNWSFGWGQEEKKPQVQNNNKNLHYHNQSNIQMNDNVQLAEEEERKKQEEKRKKEEELNSKLPQYDPKKGGQSNVFFGDQKTDYRKKDQVFTSVRVNNPPGGRSNIQFG